jgi:hypothetical protein
MPSRYDRFAHTFSDVVKAVGTIRKIAGNEETVVSFAVLQDDQRPPRGELIARFPHTGFESAGCLSEDCRSRTIAARQAIADPCIEYIFDS